MSDWGKIGGAIIGFAIGGPSGAIAGAGIGNTLIDQPKAAKKQAEAAISTQKRIAEEQLELQERQVGEYVELTEAQMRLQAGTSMITTLAELIRERESPAPQVFTLPAAKTYTPTQQINIAIGKMLRG